MREARLHSLLLVCVAAGCLWPAAAEATSNGSRFSRTALAVADRTEAAREVRDKHPGARTHEGFYRPGGWRVTYVSRGTTVLEVDVDVTNGPRPHGHVVQLW